MERIRRVCVRASDMKIRIVSAKISEELSKGVARRGINDRPLAR
jgi:hypothetical protein